MRAGEIGILAFIAVLVVGMIAYRSMHTVPVADRDQGIPFYTTAAPELKHKAEALYKRLGQYICFNDECPYYVRGWDTFSNQGIPGSYRFMFDPESGGCHSVPVLTPTALRASIVAAEDPNARPDPTVVD